MVSIAHNFAKGSLQLEKVIPATEIAHQDRPKNTATYTFWGWAMTITAKMSKEKTSRILKPAFCKADVTSPNDSGFVEYCFGIRVLSIIK